MNVILLLLIIRALNIYSRLFIFEAIIGVNSFSVRSKPENFDTT